MKTLFCIAWDVTHFLQTGNRPRNSSSALNIQRQNKDSISYTKYSTDPRNYAATVQPFILNLFALMQFSFYSTAFSKYIFAVTMSTKDGFLGIVRMIL